MPAELCSLSLLILPFVRVSEVRSPSSRRF